MDEKQSTFMKRLLITSLVLIATISMLWVSSDAFAQVTGSCSSDGKSYCNQKSPDNCWCDRYCVRYSDCCGDYQSTCVEKATAPSQLSISVDAVSIPADGSTKSTITVTATDKKSGLKIDFVTGLGTLSTSSCTTNSTGACSVNIKSFIEGVADVKASSTGYSQVSVIVSFRSKVGASIVLENVSFKDESKILILNVKNTGTTDLDARSIVIKVTATTPDGKSVSYQQTMAISGESVPFPKNDVYTKTMIVSNIGQLEGRTKLVIELDPSDILKLTDHSQIRKEITIDLPIGFAKCVVLAQSSGEIGKKLNIVFVPDMYTDKASFVSDARSAANGILSLEPFLANSNKLNFWYVYPEGISMRKDGTVDAELAKRLSTSCPGYGEAIVLSNDFGRDHANKHFAVVITKERDAKLIGQYAVHELGHSFGSLSDEYMERSYDISTDLLTGPLIKNPIKERLFVFGSPNCDISGCPKWCSGKLDSEYSLLSEKCAQAKTQRDCRVTSFTQDESYACFWVPLEPYIPIGQLEYRCALDPDTIKRDFGTGCKPGTGCFLGCGDGANLWKSSSDSVMNKDFETNEFFNPISRQHLESLLKNYK